MKKWPKWGLKWDKFKENEWRRRRKIKNRRGSWEVVKAAASIVRPNKSWGRVFSLRREDIPGFVSSSCTSEERPIYRKLRKAKANIIFGVNDFLNQYWLGDRSRWGSLGLTLISTSRGYIIDPLYSVLCTRVCEYVMPSDGPESNSSSIVKLYYKIKLINNLEWMNKLAAI